jgi:hypothetical protein
VIFTKSDATIFPSHYSEVPQQQTRYESIH